MTDKPNAPVEALARLREWALSEDSPSMGTRKLERDFDAIAAALSTTNDSGWQPIETAPKDGTPILVWAPDDDFSAMSGIDLIWWDLGQWLFSVAISYGGRPTHWMPVPVAPADVKAVG